MNPWLFALIVWLTLNIGFVLGCVWTAGRTPIFNVTVTNPKTDTEKLFPYGTADPKWFDDE